MKMLHRKIVLAFLAFFFLGLSPINAEVENNIEKLIYSDSVEIKPTPVLHYFFGNPCRFYDYRVTHPRRCGYWYDGPYFGPYYGLGIPWFRHHHKHYYWRHHYGRHHYWRHHHRHHRFHW